jgi:hypothetical protein
MSMSGLKQFIINVRQSKTSIDESIKIDNELRQIFKQFSQPISNYTKRKLICELLYIKLSGYDLSVVNNSGVGYEISLQEFTELGIQQCMSLLDTKLSNYNEQETNLDEKLKDLKNDKEIGFLGLKSLFVEFIDHKNYEDIIKSTLVDINLITDLKDDKHTNSLNFLWQVITSSIQSIGDLIISTNDLSFENQCIIEFINTLFTLLTSNNDTPDFLKVRIIMCFAQFLNLKNNRIEEIQLNLLNPDNLTVLGELMTQSSLDNSSMIVSLCALFEKWIAYDWEGVKSLECLLVTKVDEILSVIELIQIENDKDKIKNYDWISKYGFIIVNLFNLLSKITTVANGIGLETNLQLKKIVDKLISKCVGIRAKVSNEVEISKSKNQLNNASLLMSSLNLYTNTKNKHNEIEPLDACIVIEAILLFLKFNDDINIKVVCLQKLLSIVQRTKDFGFSRKIILNEFTTWKKLIHYHDSTVSLLVSKILFETLEINKKSNDIITFTQIKDVVIILLYYLQNCDNSIRGEILTNILIILENYKDSGIIQEGARKILKIFITIGNCNDNGWEKIYQLFIYAMNEMLLKGKDDAMIQLILDFICKGLSIRCCDNFIKLSSLILEYNCKNWIIGDLNYQLGLLIEKYETSTVLTKLLLLDTMNAYYYTLKNDKLKDLIKLAFEQESQNANIQIKQKAFEYFVTINLNIDIKINQNFDIKNITKLPEIIPPKPKDKKIDLSENWKEGYIRCIRFDQGILYNNEKIRVTFRIKREKNKCNIELNYKLKNCENIDNFKCQLIKGDSIDDIYDIQTIENTGIQDSESQTGILILKHSLIQLYSEEQEPIIKFEIDGIEINLKLALALKTLHISEGNKMSIETFEARWKQIGQFMSKTGCFTKNLQLLNKDKKSLQSLSEFVIRYLNKMNLEIVSTTVTYNDFYVALAGIVDTPSNNLGCLVVVSSQSVETRCTGVIGAQEICDRIVLALESIG